MGAALLLTGKFRAQGFGILGLGLGGGAGRGRGASSRDGGVAIGFSGNFRARGLESLSSQSTNPRLIRSLAGDSVLKLATQPSMTLMI